MDISIIIPAFNEGERIEITLKKIIQYFSDYRSSDRYEIIVVDDGSTDNTKEVIEGLRHNNLILLVNKRNMGKGYSVKRGILYSKYPLVLLSDSDLSTPIHELDRLIKFLNNEFEIVIGSRNMREKRSPIERSWYRTMISKGFNLLVTLIVFRGFKDTQCGFKLYKCESIKRILHYQTLKGFTFDVEILFIARKFGYKIKEVPVSWYERKGSTVSLFGDSARMILDLIRIRFLDITGKYK